MTLYGYARVSTVGQDLAIQEAALRAAGCRVVRAEKRSGAAREGWPSSGALSNSYARATLPEDRASPRSAVAIDLCHLGDWIRAVPRITTRTSRSAARSVFANGI